MSIKKKCSNHPEKDALSFCHACKSFFCEDCLIEGPRHYYCKSSTCRALYYQELDYLRDPRFCPQCLEETTDESAGDIVSVNFIGDKFAYEGREECPTCGSRVVEKIGSFFGRKGSFRVIFMPDDQTKFISRKMKIVHVCEVCGRKIRFPHTKKTIAVKCPSCQKDYHFKNGKQI